MHLLKVLLFMCLTLQVSALVLDKRRSRKPTPPECYLPKINHFEGYALSVYTEPDCGGKHETFSDWGFSGCKNFEDTVERNVKAFVFSAAHPVYSISFYTEKNCQGHNVGTSAGSWRNPYVSPTAQTMQSFKVDLF